MKVIMPMAGKGTRLLPLTKRVPKPLVNVAGRPVMDYVMDALHRAGQLEELIIITGHLKEKVEQYVRTHYDIPARFIEQKVLDGTAGAVNLARPYVDGPVIVIFIDTLFDADHDHLFSSGSKRKRRKNLGRTRSQRFRRSGIRKRQTGSVAGGRE